jgi:hypothetical protein
LIPERTPVGRRQRRWDRISWWYSLLFVLPLLGLIVTLAMSTGDDESLNGVVLDAYTGSPVSGATVSTANATATTNGSGEFSLADLTATILAISREAYESTEVAVSEANRRIEVSLRPTTVQGVITNSRTGEPMPGLTVAAVGPNGETVTTVTDQQGRYILVDVPVGATISVFYEGFTVVSRVVGDDVGLDFQIRPDVLTGRVTNSAGAPVPGASVSIGDALVTTGEDGSYRLGAVPESGTIVIKKAGYRDITAQIPESLEFNAQLEEFLVRAIYVTAHTASSDARWAEMLSLADSTEVNAIVLDIKDSSGLIYYETGVPLAHQIGAVTPVYDVQQKLKDMRDRGIYSIARLVVFEDPLLAVERSDLAIRDRSTGGLWTTWNGLAWVNAHEREVWKYNIALAVEAATLGFDEIQLDYIRFPSDGLLELADYGPQHADSTRLDSITTFLSEMQKALAPTGSLLAVDLFGITMWDDDDGGIGQNFAAIAPFVDVVCPMIYPSHFYPGAIGLDIPNNHPYEVIFSSLQHGAAMVPDARDKLRPWLQDFSYGEGIEYGDAEVRAQIQAVDDFGATGWMIWNPANDYSEGSFNRP